MKSLIFGALFIISKSSVLFESRIRRVFFSNFSMLSCDNLSLLSRKYSYKTFTYFSRSEILPIVLIFNLVSGINSLIKLYESLII